MCDRARYLVEDRNPTGYAQVMEEIPDQSTLGLVGYWRLDEGTGGTALDQSGSGYNGTLVNGPVRSSGRAGGAVTFDGVNDYIQVGAQPGLVMTTAMTISAWIRSTGSGGIIVNKEGEYELGIVSGKLYWSVANLDPGTNGVNTGWTVPTNQWVHVAVVYGAGMMRAYANGAAIYIRNGSGLIGDAITGLNDFRIGGRQGAAEYFSGSIDEVRVYNRALSADEIQGLAGDSVQYVYGLDLISQKRNGTTRYYGYDGLGSVRYVADDDGDVVDTYTYDAFGILTERKARTSGETWALFDISQPETPPTGTTPTVNNYRYTGEQWDPDLGMYYLRARYYNPQIGRFWTMDSYEGSSQDPLSLHKYLYCQGNPINTMDPSGHDAGYTAPGQGMVGAIEGIMARMVLPALNRSYSYAVNKVITAMLNPALTMDYLQLWSGYLTAASLAVEVAAATTRTIIDNVSRNTMPIPSEDMLRGVALEKVAARRLGSIHLGGNVSTIDMYDASGSKMAISVKSYDLATDSPLYERTLTSRMTRDIRELQKLDTVGAWGTTVSGENFQLARGEAQIKLLVGLVPQDKSLVLTSRNFLTCIRNAAAAVEAGAAESRAVLVLPLPVKNWQGKR